MNHTILPRNIAAGTSVVYRRATPFLPADGWTLMLAIGVPGFAPVAAVADGAGHLVTVPAAATATWPAGTYAFTERVTNGTLVHEIGRGTVNVSADVSAVAGDGRTHAQRALSAIEAALEGRFEDGIQSYAIGGRTVSKIPLKELYELRDKYRIQVFRERNAGRFGSIQIGFGGN